MTKKINENRTFNGKHDDNILLLIHSKILIKFLLQMSCSDGAIPVIPESVRLGKVPTVLLKLVRKTDLSMKIAGDWARSF